MSVHMTFEEQRLNLVKNLKEEGLIKSKAVESAFLKVPREKFVWPDEVENAYLDIPLPLGKTRQTISAPHMVAIMLEALELRRGLKVLEVGCGSGYSAALMAEIVGSNGRVVSIERIPELVEFAKRNLANVGYSDVVEVILGDGCLGYPPRSEEEIYDRVVVTAAASTIPKYLKKQTKQGGLLLIPVGGSWSQTLKKLVKISVDKFDVKDVTECVFVPLVESDEAL
ncbi:MAG: protein-L-isoaspartate(D-aspartate) O-methyltransferase [Nitrososphaerales archaeon]